MVSETTGVKEKISEIPIVGKSKINAGFFINVVIETPPHRPAHNIKRVNKPVRVLAHKSQPALKKRLIKRITVMVIKFSCVVLKFVI